ncbi:nuclear transport factor 2 family protein [Pseudarthrobacter sp. fls2-241-R2A-168]|uniref:nuclear transport factor 2 family protein n=1 Tax=Pseudarthrobacter sp. fls2-241-R2A-168 TaxID=3040304 RepID=UPI002553E952|nr:nuclear transport factor 2 family protein [Pseudarthrobacter sp. fls2-241-R2A-168]
MLDSDLIARVAALEAKEEVRATIAHYNTIADEMKALDHLMDMFTDDAVVYSSSGKLAGRVAIEKFFRRAFDGGTEFNQHYVTNQVVDILPNGFARHRAYFVALQGSQGESKIILGQYDDRLVRTNQGWKFSSKVHAILGVTTPEAGWAHGFAETSPE